MKTAAVLIGSYLMGAIPFGVIIARVFYHTDIRQHGSRNTGATNGWRVLGRKPGITTLLLDALKGVIPVLVAKRIGSETPSLALVAGLAAIIGHNWSLFLMGSGGKGVATSAGVFLALVPLQGLIALISFLIFFLTTRHVSVGSVCGATALLISTFIIDTPPMLRWLIGAAAIMIVVKHVPNMKRLAKGEEPKVNFR